MIHALGISIHSVLKLSAVRDMAIRDGYGIARSATELAVNICYIAAGGGEIARRAERHALQKSHRDLHRTGSVGGVAFELRRGNKPESDDVPGLVDALAEFTGRKGQEITDWTPLNISARIESISKVHPRAALALSGSTMAVYRHASEILHGTYFGVYHFWSGSGVPTTTRDQLERRWNEHFVAIFTALFFGAQAVVELFATVLELPNLADAQGELLLATGSYIEAAAAAPE